MTLEIHSKKLYSRFWDAVNWLELCLLGPSTSYFFGNQLFRFDMQKENSKNFIVFTPSWSTIIIF